MNEFETCDRCIMHTGIAGVFIHEDGECNFCKLHDEWDMTYRILKGENGLHEILDQIKAEGKGKPYDCIIGISGGCDSSYALDYIVEYGLNPLAVHWDNNWNTVTANENIRKLVQGLGIDSFRVGVNREEYDDILRSFLIASVPDADIPNDIAIAKALYVAADYFDSKFIINAHSFRTEGTTPLSWTYMDGGYIKNVHDSFGTIPMKTFPNLEFEEFKYYIKRGFQRIRPLWYLEYDKKKAIRNLEKKYNWRWYGSHHFENTYTIFVSAVLWRNKFSMDLRYIEFSALIRSEFMNRDDAIKEIGNPPNYDPVLPYKVRRRLGLNEDEWRRIMIELPKRTYKDFENYQQLFQNDWLFFKKAVDQGLIPETFYKKYVEGVD